VITSFVAGAITGATVMWIWGDRIREQIDAATGDVRTRTAERLHGAADRLQSAADTIQEGLGGASLPRS
jgi:hypothetical protein